MADVNHCISEDLWFEIFKKLPVKSLGKCRCVCKSWYALIASPSFMAAHLKHYTLNDSNSLLLHKHCCKNYEQFDLYRDSTHFKKGITSSILYTSTTPFMLPYKRFRLIGSINGLLCLSDNDYPGSTDHIFIWNPLLQKSVLLPKSLSDAKIDGLGFGYNCRNNDHVVLKLCRSRTTLTRLVEIYSVQERTWRTIFADYLLNYSKYNICYYTQYFFNGFIHWLVTEREPLNFCRILVKWVLRFNVAEETFDRMELPPLTPIGQVVRDVFGIFEYQRKLSLSRFCYDYIPYISLSYEIWVQEGNNSWCKILKGCVPECHHLGPIQYVGVNEEVVGFYKENTSELVSYDPKTNQSKGLGLSASVSTKFISYSESLVLLDHNTDDITAEEFGRVHQILEDNSLCL